MIRKFINRRLKLWTLRVAATLMFILVLLAGIVLKPSLLYAHSTDAGNYTIYHQQSLAPQLLVRLNAANRLLKSSELYDSSLKLSLCLQDGSTYPLLMTKLRGAAFGWGFGHNVVLGADINVADNYAEINGYRWNLVSLLAHEATHCLECQRYGLWQSVTVNYTKDKWKWEGYPEYIARQEHADLCANITHLLVTEKTDNNNWIYFSDSTGTVIPYYKAWLLVQYSMDVRHLTFDYLMKEGRTEEDINHEMMLWYRSKL
jgi:hypothetical protein